MAEGSRASLLGAVRARVREAGVFGDVGVQGERLICTARDSAEPAEYRLDWDDEGRLWVSLVTANRWLSESIEADLMHTGDKMEELLEEELVDLGYEGATPKIEHFRSEDLLFTFRSPLPAPDAASAAVWLLAYEACFRQLGDMGGADED